MPSPELTRTQIYYGRFGQTSSRLEQMTKKQILE